MPKKELIGIITSDKMQKTVVVKVERIKEHPLYRRRYKVHQKYKAHIENQADYKIGDKVKIRESRPLSKDKKWEVVEKLEK
jgi:small subunit ribosomal protein S17